MVTFDLILHGALRDLAPGRGPLSRRLPAATSVKDAVEAAGPPHCEIGAVHLDGRPASLTDLVPDGAFLEAWPVEPEPLPDPRFLCDLHLGKLARLLRFCGFDTLWDPAWREPAMARVAVQDGRTVLSRHRALLKRSAVTNAMLIRSNDADGQLVEVLRRFRLAGRITRPGRCAVCNGVLSATRREDVTVPIPPRTAAWLEDYWVCEGCGKLFWDGTHVERLRGRVERAVALAG